MPQPIHQLVALYLCNSRAYLGTPVPFLWQTMKDVGVNKINEVVVEEPCDEGFRATVSPSQVDGMTLGAVSVDPNDAIRSDPTKEEKLV